MDARRGVPGASPSHRVEENFSVKVIFLDVDGTMNTMLEDVDCRTTHSHKVFRRGTDDPRLLGLTGELADRAIAILNSTIPRPQKRAPSP